MSDIPKTVNIAGTKVQWLDPLDRQHPDECILVAPAESETGFTCTIRDLHDGVLALRVFLRYAALAKSQERGDDPAAQGDER